MMFIFCRTHYKEYLVSLINKHKIDPLEIMSLQQMKILIQRNELEPPKLQANSTEERYRKLVIQVNSYLFKMYLFMSCLALTG